MSALSAALARIGELTPRIDVLTAELVERRAVERRLGFTSDRDATVRALTELADLAADRAKAFDVAYAEAYADPTGDSFLDELRAVDEAVDRVFRAADVAPF